MKEMLKRQAAGRANFKKARAHERQKQNKSEDNIADEIEAKRRAVDKKAEEAANRQAVVNGAPQQAGNNGGASAASRTPVTGNGS